MDHSHHLIKTSTDQRDLSKLSKGETSLKKLINLGNMQYQGELYLGAPVSQVIPDIAFDTGSLILAIMSKKCNNC